MLRPFGAARATGLRHARDRNGLPLRRATEQLGGLGGKRNDFVDTSIRLAMQQLVALPSWRGAEGPRAARAESWRPAYITRDANATNLADSRLP